MGDRGGQGGGGEGKGRSVIYLDNAATSWPKPPEVLEAIREAIEDYGANPGRSGHRMAIEAARILYETREALAEFFGADDPERFVFTKNITEAINLVLYGLLNPGDHVITTSMEHNSVMRPLRHLETLGVDVTVVRASPEGRVDPEDIKRAIKGNTRLIAMVHLSNVTGTVMPVEEVIEIAHGEGIPVLLDCAQSAGTLPIDLKKLPVDFLAFTGHKALFGPQGTGGLYLRPGMEREVRPLMRGGTGSRSEEEHQPDFLPDKYESGTPNTPGIAGLGAGVRFLLREGMEKVEAKKRALTRLLLEGLKEIKGVELYGTLEGDHIGIVSFRIFSRAPSEVAMMLDERYGVLSRPGLHCAPQAHRTIGTFPDGTVRFSVGYLNSEEEVLEAVRAVEELARGG